MKLELFKASDGSGLSIIVSTDRRKIMIPLATQLSVEIDKMLREEAGNVLLTLPSDAVLRKLSS
jgi:hypothetical protein